MPSDTPDPSAFFRELFAQFAAGGPTTEGGKTDDLARMFTGPGAFKAMIERALATANVPARGEMEDLAARIARIEAALFRIEARLAELGGSAEPR